MKRTHQTPQVIMAASAVAHVIHVTVFFRDSPKRRCLTRNIPLFGKTK